MNTTQNERLHASYQAERKELIPDAEEIISQLESAGPNARYALTVQQVSDRKFYGLEEVEAQSP